jgi:hypothetical protein
MEVGSIGQTSGPHGSWKRHDCPNLPGSKKQTIGTVAASVSYTSPAHVHISHLTTILIEYFTIDYYLSGHPVKYWTILALFPKSILVYDRKRETEVSNFWAAMIQLITESLEAATGSWNSIAIYMEQLLPPSDTDEILKQDRDFSLSKRLFWIISKVDQALPIITDALDQWRWFAEAHGLHKERDSEAPPMEEGGLPSHKDLETLLEQIRRLNACQAGFEALRERAVSLRDGVTLILSP